MRSAFSSAAVIFAVAGLASAQTIDPDSVSIEDRNQWCLSQTSQCPLICLQTAGNSATTQENECDAQTLVYSCVCSNGISPNVSEYSQTMPYYICTENNNRCVNNCASGNNQCASDCRTKNLCGAQNPTRVNTTTTASSTSASATSSSTGSNFNSFGDGDSGDSSSSKSGAGALALDLGAKYGLAMIISGLVGGAAVLL
ncbi:hypothetical protein GTA08_BOTSDO13357 [Neofusicoccum parvum]|uniref:DUF7707 domain-containing protein n=2 Tax=Neofusicoccum parvum TaxID=310453 RepID=R1GUD7_BOTPV|nr:hypothetical protein UCRNP2_1318 [Neofusicoccum parvum UCRNP2]GME22448.1 hypothetical protein GTA08_BOTSDO13357 [Neofusicoccum parvum]GME64713.1 hypothetical protein GTA08_BOTSDO13357 [Neofusicoccum parvum]